MAAPEELIRQVPLFADLDKKDIQGIASTMKERQFNAGDTIASEGSTGIGFFIIDDGARTATITAKTPLKCYGVTSWEFRPLVENNSKLAWKMLETMAKRLRGAEQRAS